MATYVYPQNKLEIIDGALRPINSVPRDLTVIIERAYTGPVDSLYITQDLTEAKRVYGDGSPILAAAQRAVSGGAENVALYRIGGRPYEYVNLFGEASTFMLTDQSVAAADNLKVYIGPEPKAADRSCLIVFEGDRIIYSNVLGGEINSRKILVQGFDKQNLDLKVGTIDNPVPFRKIADEMLVAADSTVTAKKDNIDSKDWIYVDPNDISGFTPATDEISEIQLYLNDVLVNDVKVSTDGTKLLVNEYVDGSTEVVKENDSLKVTFKKKPTEDEKKTLGFEYVPGEDSMNATWEELYAKLDLALDQLELLPTKALYAGDLFNVPNIAEGSTNPNKLRYLIKGEDLDGNATYEWSDKKFVYRKKGTADETTTEISEAELDVNNQPIIVKRYNEVDFVHRLGMFAWLKEADGIFLNVVVGSRGPENGSKRAINNWLGTSPKRDVQGNIVEDGTGLLGHRLMIGTVNHRGGYYATDNGFVDGNVLVDRTGFLIDLGKHLSIVVSQVSSVQNPNQFTSAGAAYAGLVSTLRPGYSTTNAKINDMLLVTEFRESKVRELAKSGYVVLVEKPQGTTVYSGDLATRDDSDYDYISTANTVAAITQVIRDVTEPYLGRGMDSILLTAMKTQLTTALGNVQKEGWMNSFEFKIRRDGPNAILIPFQIEAKDELRKINNIVRLVQSDLNLEV